MVDNLRSQALEVALHVVLQVRVNGSGLEKVELGRTPEHGSSRLGTFVCNGSCCSVHGTAASATRPATTTAATAAATTQSALHLG
ncbi:hypothetical protein E6H19_05680 [Candidatus Bathyarchaeota archaeon]|nr:MAG: hypothetical protein E6H19_05680 [Candidatus Bathyarchaeota archaeon]